jgi:hypothetical protein
MSLCRRNKNKDYCFFILPLGKKEFVVATEEVGG